MIISTEITSKGTSLSVFDTAFHPEIVRTLVDDVGQWIGLVIRDTVTQQKYVIEFGAPMFSITANGKETIFTSPRIPDYLEITVNPKLHNRACWHFVGTGLQFNFSTSEFQELIEVEFSEAMQRFNRAENRSKGQRL
jgi:hypothetical protein